MAAKPLFTCTAPYEVLFVTRDVLADLMPDLSPKAISAIVHHLHALVPDLDAKDDVALVAALNLLAEVS